MSLPSTDDDPVKTALTNALILRSIFTYLPFESLKEFRLVSQMWNFEVGSYIRDFRRCDAEIVGHPFSRLQEFIELVSNMVTIVPINSLTVNCRGFQSSCTCTNYGLTFNAIEELIKKLPLKYVCLTWNYTRGSESCLANRIADGVFQNKSLELRVLELRGILEEFVDAFPENWIPWMPKLDVIIVGVVTGSKPEDFIFKILNGASNLQKIQWHNFGLKFPQDFPPEKYALLDYLYVSITSVEDERNWLQVAQAGPCVSKLYLIVPSYEERDYFASFLRILEMILTSSCKTLETLTVWQLNFPFSLINFPPLINLKKMEIHSLELRQDHLVNILRSIDYPRLLPAVEKTGVYPETPDLDHPWLFDGAFRFDVNPSTTMQHLSVPNDFTAALVQGLAEVFPNIRYFDARSHHFGPTPTPTPYAELWACWPHLQEINLIETFPLWRNFDAEFLGINVEEVEILRQLDEESLEKMHIVPVRPSILTLPELKRIDIGFFLEPAPCEVNPEQVFLSKLTGILAFRKLVNKGVDIRFPGADSRLRHLSPFVNFT